jgi:hypothetical protein
VTIKANLHAIFALVTAVAEAAHETPLSDSARGVGAALIGMVEQSGAVRMTRGALAAHSDIDRICVNRPAIPAEHKPSGQTSWAVKEMNPGRRWERRQPAQP